MYYICHADLNNPYQLLEFKKIDESESLCEKSDASFKRMDYVQKKISDLKPNTKYRFLIIPQVRVSFTDRYGFE